MFNIVLNYITLYYIICIYQINIFKSIIKTITIIYIQLEWKYKNNITSKLTSSNPNPITGQMADIFFMWLAF